MSRKDKIVEDFNPKNETWTENLVRRMFEDYDGTLICGMRIGTNSLPAENHSHVRFGISTYTNLLEEIEEKFVKPVNEYFIEKNESPYLNNHLKVWKYEGYTDASIVFEHIFNKAVEEFQEYAEQDNLWERLIKEEKRLVEKELGRQSKSEVA